MENATKRIAQYFDNTDYFKGAKIVIFWLDFYPLFFHVSNGQVHIVATLHIRINLSYFASEISGITSLDKYCFVVHALPAHPKVTI